MSVLWKIRDDTLWNPVIVSRESPVLLLELFQLASLDLLRSSPVVRDFASILPETDLRAIVMVLQSTLDVTAPDVDQVPAIGNLVDANLVGRLLGPVRRVTASEWHDCVSMLLENID